MRSQPVTRLVLWDVDHTLIETRGVGRRFFHQAFEAVTGQKIKRDVEVTGRTETAIFTEALRLHNITPSTDLAERYQTELTRQYIAGAGELGAAGRALPGAYQALAELARIPGVAQGLLTGNFRAVARIKLSVFGLDHQIDFRIGAYGEDNPERARLVTVAQQRATEHCGVAFTSHNTVLIGDSEQDVTAARSGGVHIIAIASGRDSAVQLTRAGAQLVLPDLTHPNRLVEALVLADS